MFQEDPFAPFEKAGQKVVRENLARNLYGESKKRLAETWLAQQTRDAYYDARAEEAGFARRSTEAAETQAAEASKANRIALAALFFSLVAIVISLCALASGQQ